MKNEKTTLGNHSISMPTLTAPSATADIVSKMRLYDSDHELAGQIQDVAQLVFRQITVQEILL